MQIIKTSAGQLYRVRETGDQDTSHVWIGIEVKRTADGFTPKKNAREVLVRKSATSLVCAA